MAELASKQNRGRNWEPLRWAIQMVLWAVVAMLFVATHQRDAICRGLNAPVVVAVNQTVESELVAE